MSTYKGLYEACAITVGSNGEPVYPYYDQQLLTDYVTEFVAENVGKYVTSYDLSIKFYDINGTKEVGVNDLARTAKVYIKTKINLLFTYEKEQSCSIKERA